MVKEKKYTIVIKKGEIENLEEFMEGRVTSFVFTDEHLQEDGIIERLIRKIIKRLGEKWPDEEVKKVVMGEKHIELIWEREEKIKKIFNPIIKKLNENKTSKDDFNWGYIGIKGRGYTFHNIKELQKILKMTEL